MSPREREVCWAWCRDVLYWHWGLRATLVAPTDAFLKRPGASFVTFERAGELRGCIGSLAAVDSLLEDLRKNTLASATRDPRFPPIGPEERHDLHLEVSILSPCRPLDLPPEDLLEYLRRERPGLVLHHGSRRATFLPQVWEDLPDPVSFLERLSAKAGLARQAWRDPATRFETYTVDRLGKPLEGGT